MPARVDYLVKTKNRCVVSYSSDGTTGWSYIDLGPSGGAWGATQGEFKITGIGITAASLSRVVGSCGGANGEIVVAFAGTTPYYAYTAPGRSTIDANFERFTIPNMAVGSTGLVSINNNLSPGGTANIIMEFVTRHV